MSRFTRLCKIVRPLVAEAAAFADAQCPGEGPSTIEPLVRDEARAARRGRQFRTGPRNAAQRRSLARYLKHLCWEARNASAF